MISVSSIKGVPKNKKTTFSQKFCYGIQCTTYTYIRKEFYKKGEDLYEITVSCLR